MNGGCSRSRRRAASIISPRAVLKGFKVPLATWLHSTATIQRNDDNTTVAMTHIGSKRVNGDSHGGVDATSTTTTSIPAEEERKKHEKLTNRPRTEASDGEGTTRGVSHGGSQNQGSKLMG
ncbi:hypothetical protein V6N13_030030 [Hibiscus sabdariffa]|uniref:Uncharacterized protein n=2 Tax=Hibiscus sabdariffa TaxID=183260 RepID=A0ABR2T866_9ROSI